MTNLDLGRIILVRHGFHISVHIYQFYVIRAFIKLIIDISKYAYIGHKM